jgi:hypothetical protein
MGCQLRFAIFAQDLSEKLKKIDNDNAVARHIVIINSLYNNVEQFCQSDTNRFGFQVVLFDL